jgi:hypothetical protein
MSSLLEDVTHEFRRHKAMADKALSGLDDDAFFKRPGKAVNPVALIVKHLAGNLASRWKDFLTTDGEKPTRNRDAEFLLSDQDTRAHLMAGWEKGWWILLETMSQLTAADLEKTIAIRGESLTVTQALVRGSCHAAYHVGQILYVARMLNPGGEWLTIAPGKSKGVPGAYRNS